jgi:hypothetical protein
MDSSGSCKERRRGKDRRKHIDPRYRNPAYPEFVDRRKGERRKPVYDDVHPFVKEHPIRKWIIVVGIMVAAFLTYVFLFTNLFVSQKRMEEKDRKGTLFIGYAGDEEITGSPYPFEKSRWMRAGSGSATASRARIYIEGLEAMAAHVRGLEDQPLTKKLDKDTEVG